MIIFKTFFFHFVYFLVWGSSDNIWEALDHFYLMEMKGYCSCAMPGCKEGFLTYNIDNQTTQCLRSILMFNLCLKIIKSSKISYMFHSYIMVYPVTQILRISMICQSWFLYLFVQTMPPHCTQDMVARVTALLTNTLRFFCLVKSPLLQRSLIL